MEKDNANPTILNTSQLPTRQNKRKTIPQKVTTNEFEVIPSYLSKPFSDNLWSDDTDASDDFTAEPIDEQEIFGEVALSVLLSPFNTLYLRDLYLCTWRLPPFRVGCFQATCPVFTLSILRWLGVSSRTPIVVVSKPRRFRVFTCLFIWGENFSLLVRMAARCNITIYNSKSMMSELYGY